MTSQEMERRLRLLETRVGGFDYCATQDAIDERNAKDVSDAEARTKLPVDAPRRFADETDSEYAARVYNA